MAACPRESRWITHTDSPQTTGAPCFCYKFLLVEIIPVLPILSPSFAQSPSYQSLVYASPRGRVNVVEQSAVGVHDPWTALHSHNSPSKVPQRTRCLLVTPLTTLRSVHSKKADSTHGGIECVSVDYSCYLYKRAIKAFEIAFAERLSIRRACCQYNGD